MQPGLLLLERVDLVQISLEAPARRIPVRVPDAGEQYRFHFDMAKCIGCKCCVVACNEQNGNPDEINWRRVGELEGGVFPLAQRFHLSMGCNHCVEPTCLSGCPVEAYTKDTLTGIVDHSADACIGCQYCVWNCSYGVPQYNPERGVVGKCDMCHSRLDAGREPACVDACPEGAIVIEIVDIHQWRSNYSAANAPGMPSADDSISTTRITVPAKATNVTRVDEGRVVPEHVHYSLVALLIFMQTAAGAALVAGSPWIAAAAAAVGLAFAPLHLGRPIHAYRAWRGWRTSWLSREVIAFSLFGAATAVVFWRPSLWPLAAITGLVGTYCSARIYMIPARPAWNSLRTLLDFFFTALCLGPLAIALVDSRAELLWVAAAALAGQIAVHPRRSTVLRLLAIVAMAIHPGAALALALLSETTARIAFFAEVVPKSMASTFMTPKGALP